MTTANFIVLGSKKSTKSNPARMVINFNIPTEKGMEMGIVTLEYKKETGWDFMENMNTTKSRNIFSFYVLHEKSIHLKAFQELADSYYKYGRHLDEYMGMQRIHKWDLY